MKTTNKKRNKTKRSSCQHEPLVIPHRVQRKRTRGWKMPENTIYVGRPSKWGNPFVFADQFREGKGETIVETRDEAIEKFENVIRFWKQHYPEQYEQYIAPLRGKNLACWCPSDKKGHADVLLLNAVSV